ncbi:hypothetical protein HDV04_005436 [Boothiomyces sp. JEL0838]|nr:hypothetical protein HDV04_005436 [Boothiomyces sp. JEL0838]
MFKSYTREELSMIYGAVIYGRMYSDTKWIFTQYLNTEFQIILEAAAATELYLQAVHEMNTTLIQTIFQSNIIQDISTHNQVFLKSCSFIDLDLLELFLDDERIDFNFRMGQNSVVSFAADNPRKEILERIMKEDGLEIRIGDLTLILELNIKHQHVLELLQHNRMQPFLNENNDMPIIVASRTGQYAVVKYLLEQESVNPAAQNNLAVIEAAATGNFDLVQLLVNDDRSNTELIDYIIDEKILTLEEFNSTHLLALAIRNYQELLKNVIEKSHLSISYSQNNVNYLEFLYRNGQHGPLRLLSPLLDQSFEGTSWLETQSILALTDENYQIFEMYLSNKYYNLSSFITAILKLLITQDKPELVAKVLDHKSFKPTKFIEVFKHLMRTDNLEIAKMLLKDKRIDPSHKGNTILKRACSKRKPEFVKLLLNHKKVDPSDNDYEAIRIAAQNGFEDVLDVFRKSEKVDPKVFDKINL